MLSLMPAYYIMQQYIEIIIKIVELNMHINLIVDVQT